METVATDEKEQGGLLQPGVMCLTCHAGIILFVAFEHLLQRVAGVAQCLHLAVECGDLVVQRANEFLLVLDVLLREL